ncbi:MAG: ABC transporter ATP-binding protein [Propionibacteriaceae bacterium]|nr:ABC transporter ATP-binding protein [Propionibacteriaceae bacterium]
MYGSGDTLVCALDDVSVNFAAGTFTAIMGPSGSGKSTLMHCLAGLDRPTAGSVVVGNTRLENLDDNNLTKLRRDEIGFIFQSFNLLPTHTAKENILLPLKLAGRRADKALLEQLVTSLSLTRRMNHLPSQMSGGEQQRVAVARALISQPKVIFADEPTGALDSRNSTRLLEYLREASSVRGQTIIMVTHDATAAAFADRALVLADGHIIDDIADPARHLTAATVRTWDTRTPAAAPPLVATPTSGLPLPTGHETATTQPYAPRRWTGNATSDDAQPAARMNGAN